MLVFSKLKTYHFVTLVAWLSRGLQAILQVLIMSTLTQILDVTEYSVFILISSLLVWFMLADIGLGYALQNKISKLKSCGKDYEVFIANAFFAGFFLVLLFVLLTWLISFTLLPVYLSGVAGEADYQSEFMMSAVLMICSGVFRMIYKVWFALGKGYWSSILPAIASLAAYLILLYLLSINKTALYLVFLACFLPLALFSMLPYTVYLYRLRHKINLKIEFFRSLLIKSGDFLFFGFMSALVLNIDFFIASQFLSADQIVQYSTLLKIFTLGMFIYSAFLMAIWPVFSEKIAAKDSEVVLEMLKKYLPIGMIFIIFFTLLVIQFGPYLYVFLIKNTSLNITAALVVLFGVYFLIRVWTDTFAMVLQSGNNLKPLIRILPIQALLSVIMQLVLANYFHIYGLLIGVILSFIFTVVWYLPITSYKFLKENSGHAPSI